MKTAMYENYKPMDSLGTSCFMSDLPHDYGLVCERRQARFL